MRPLVLRRRLLLALMMRTRLLSSCGSAELCSYQSAGLSADVHFPAASAGLRCSLRDAYMPHCLAALPAVLSCSPEPHCQAAVQPAVPRQEAQ